MGDSGYMDAAAVPRLDAGDETHDRLDPIGPSQQERIDGMGSDPAWNAAINALPDAEDDTLREQLAEEIFDAIPPATAGDALKTVDALLPRIREHVAAAVQAERERLAQNLQARAPSPGDAYHKGEFASGVRSGLVNAADIIRNGGDR